MTRIDLHPEELIDAERDGTLDARGAARLAEHRASCAACATEHALVASLARSAAPSDDDRAIAARLVARMFEGETPLALPTAVAAVQREVTLEKRATVESTEPTRSTETTARAEMAARRRRRTAFFAMAAVLALAASAAAWRALTPTTAPARDVSESSNESSPHGRPATRAGAHMAEPLAAVPLDSRAQAVDVNAQGVHAQSVDVRTQTVDARTPSDGVRARTPNNAAAPLPDADASALFAAANLARRSGRQSEAASLYRALAQRFPGSREEVVARVTFGYLLLDRMGRARDALPLFESYLAIEHDGALDEEARVGLARSLGRLGRVAEERRALEGLLARHPDGVHAATARARLEVLDR